jgi:hypothetical protein
VPGSSAVSAPVGAGSGFDPETVLDDYFPLVPVNPILLVPGRLGDDFPGGSGHFARDCQVFGCPESAALPGVDLCFLITVSRSGFL